jgi:hypothetical protein
MNKQIKELELARKRLATWQRWSQTAVFVGIGSILTGAAITALAVLTNNANWLLLSLITITTFAAAVATWWYINITEIRRGKYPDHYDIPRIQGAEQIVAEAEIAYEAALNKETRRS